MSHIPYTICRSGTYYYNRRVPKHAVKAYGPFIRQALSKCPEETETYAIRLSYVLEGSWSNTTSIQPVDIPTILSSFKPRSFKLSEIALEYVAVKGIDPRPPRIALQSFISLAGDRDVGEYMREDAKLFLRHLEMSGNKTHLTVKAQACSKRAGCGERVLENSKKIVFPRSNLPIPLF